MILFVNRMYLIAVSSILRRLRPSKPIGDWPKATRLTPILPFRLVSPDLFNTRLLPTSRHAADLLRSSQIVLARDLSTSRSIAKGSCAPHRTKRFPGFMLPRLSAGATKSSDVSAFAKQPLASSQRFRVASRRTVQKGWGNSYH